MRISDWSSDVCSSDLHAEGLRTTAYHSTIKGARDFAEEMQSRGYRVDVVDSKAGRDHNSMVLDKYGNGELDMIVSVKMIDEGLDVPATREVLILRERTSEVEFMQIARIRVVEGKNGTVS